VVLVGERVRKGKPLCVVRQESTDENGRLGDRKETKAGRWR